jgi:flagellar protein FliS
MANSAQETYLESRILSADPLELVEILYEGALDSLETARKHMREGDIAARSRAIGKVHAILSELAISVKHDAGASFSHDLVELYDYMQRRLIEANRQQVEKPLSEVAGLLATLLEGWRGCRSQAVNTEPHPVNSTEALPASSQPAPAYSVPPGEDMECVGSQSWTL